VVFATFLYAFQLYTNFSGSMDLVLGMSECLGLRMPENFDVPFLSQTVAEYWRRWHITLGVWMKEYVFYPLLRTKFFTTLANRNKKRFGKKTGKMLTSFGAMLILWLTVGLWHGGDLKFVIGSGLLHFLYIMLEEIFEKPFRSLWEKLKIDPQHKILCVLRVIRTFLLVNIGFVFFRADSTAKALRMLRSSLERWNFSVFTKGHIFDLGLDRIEFVILLVSLGIMTAVEVLSRKKDVRERIAGKKLPIRWIAYFALLFYTILLGYYGPGYSAAAFIYQGF
jgi:D-alanyl-lipoteichoic acid acyltransferase DltB (MBOAT superfamily)